MGGLSFIAHMLDIRKFNKLSGIPDKHNFVLITQAWGTTYMVWACTDVLSTCQLHFGPTRETTCCVSLHLKERGLSEGVCMVVKAFQTPY